MEDMLDGLERRGGWAGISDNSVDVKTSLCSRHAVIPSYETLLIHLADILASQASRILRKLRKN